MQNDGTWMFNPDEPGATPDRVLDSTSLEEVYAAADPSTSSLASERCPSWDRHHGTIVNNESRDIVRMMATSFAEAGLTNGACFLHPTFATPSMR